MLVNVGIKYELPGQRWIPKANSDFLISKCSYPENLKFSLCNSKEPHDKSQLGFEILNGVLGPLRKIDKLVF